MLNTYLGNGSGGFGSAGLRGLAFGPANQQQIQGNIGRQALLEETLLGIQAQREARENYAINQANGLNPLQNQASIFQNSPNQLVANQNLLALLANTAALTPAAQGAAAVGNNGPLSFLSSGLGGAFGQQSLGNFAGQNPAITSIFGGQGTTQGYFFDQMMRYANQLNNNPNNYKNASASDNTPTTNTTNTTGNTRFIYGSSR